MKNILAYLIIVGVFISCNSKESKKTTKLPKEKFAIEGTCNNKENQIVYLLIVKDSLFSLLDSASIRHNKFQLTNSVLRPYKAIIKLKNHSSGFPFILTNESVQIELNERNIVESKISSSPINEEFAIIKQQSTNIFQKIDYLFPQLQRARMENDYKTLDEINLKINAIEKENKTFLINYIDDNPSKQLSALLLNDFWMSNEKDSLKLQSLAKKLVPEVQKTLNFTIH